MSTILKFYNGSSSITFDELEVHQVDVYHYQKCHLDRLQNGAPLLIKLGDERREAIIDIKPCYSDTSDEIDTLIAITNVIAMKLFNLSGTQQELFAVRVDPNATIHYYGGDKDAEKLIRLRCIEATSGEDVVPIDIYTDIIGA